MLIRGFGEDAQDEVEEKKQMESSDAGISLF
jgi:hypothetical protein